MSTSIDHLGVYYGRSEAVLIVTIIFLILVSVFVFFRVISRAVIVRKFGVDDYFILLAWAMSFGLSFCICYGARYGLGRHESNVPSSWQPSLGRIDYAFTVLYQPALMASKTSILALYLSLPTKNTVFKWACIGTLFVVNAGGLALTLVAVFQCHPIAAAFDHPIPISASCTDIVTIYLSSAPLNIITDFALLFLPMPILTGMRLPRKQKIILVITFSFGAFVPVVDVIRIAYLQSAATTRLQNAHAPGSAIQPKEHNDFSWYGSLSFMWSAIEVNVGIMCACVPALKPLVSRFMPFLVRSVDEITPHSSRVGVRIASHKTTEDTPELETTGTMESEEVEAPEPVLPRRTGLAPDDSLEMMEFLTTPDMNHTERIERTVTAMTNTSRNSAPNSPAFFDFVNMGHKKSLVQLNVRQSIFPISMVTILFFVWGFEYGLIDVLNKQFQRVSHMTPGQGTGIHSAYFAGYFAGPLLVGRPVLMRWGFKACFMVGLTVYACGTLIFWPAAVLTSFSAFVITNFIVAFGLSLLEVAADPFIALCGPARYAEVRLNLSQGIQAIGSVIAPLIANRAFFTPQIDASRLVNAQWAYLGIALFTTMLAVVFYYIPLPEATDMELEDASERADQANKARWFGAEIIWITLALGVFSQFCYVGAQEVNGTVFNTYLADIAPSEKQSNFMAIAHTAFSVSRFLAAGLGLWIKPRYLLLFFYTGAIVFQVLAMNYTGGTGTAMITMAFFMEGPLFSLIFAQSIRGMGRHTKLASVLMTAAISGGSVFSPISSHLAVDPTLTRYSLVVAVAAFAGGAVYAVYLNVVPQARLQVDPLKDPTFIPSPSDSPRRLSVVNITGRAKDFVHKGQKRRRSVESPTTEWREHKSDSPS